MNHRNILLYPLTVFAMLSISLEMGGGLSAQPTFGVTSVENCYQKVSSRYSSGSNIGKLKYRFLASQRNLKLSASNYGDINAWKVDAMDTSGIWSNLYYPVIANDSSRSVFIPPSYVSVRITNPVSWLSNLPNDTIEIDFVEPEFNLFDEEKPCLTFELGKFNVSHNLDGLCQPPEYILTLPSTANNRWGLPINWNMGLFPGIQIQNIPIGPQACQEQRWDVYGNLIPYCLEFELQIVLQPCNPSRAECPPLMMKKKLNICCFCGPYNNTQN